MHTHAYSQPPAAPSLLPCHAPLSGQIKATGPGAIVLASSKRTLFGATEATPVELSLYKSSSGSGAALATQGHPETVRYVPTTFLLNAQQGVALLVQAVVAGRVPGLRPEAMQTLTDWMNTLVARMNLSLQLWDPELFRPQLQKAFRAFMNGEE